MDSKLREIGMELENIASKPNEPISGTGEEKMLLDESGGKLVADCLKVPELEVEIKRAVWQVERSLNAKKELAEEKQDIAAATKKPKQ